ncbi:PKD domain-containing protein [Sphingobium algorifonticola]|uniref:PKD domain-containing protein n=2 Tax=Sphingobium algorifonticola TaxID=2008318 RepID=A0A437JE79_9SPHN|nr:PKD domain-containing protein [Sphingobium algorifonticola]
MPFASATAQDGTPTFQIFQFPADGMPRIDGDAADWAMVPQSYAVTTAHMTENDGKHAGPNPATLDISVKVGWVKGLNRLYFLYEAYDDYWDFALPGLHNDTFEVVVDGDASGGPLIDNGHKDVWTPDVVGAARAVRDPRISVAEAHWANHGVHAQNYHVFTPARDKDWTMAWGSPTWIKAFPYANAKVEYDFQPGQAGRLTLEFWITPYDYAGAEGPERAVESVLRENKLIGLGWVVIDYDDVKKSENNGFWTLSKQRRMFGNASDLPLFRLMPMEAGSRRSPDAQWSFTVVDMDRRLVAFRDESAGDIRSWKWDFGDGSFSTEQHPQHSYAKPGNYVVILDVTGADGTARRSKVWDVQLR